MLAVIHPEDRPRVVEQNQSLVTNPNLNLNLEFRVIWQDLSEHYIATRGQAFYDAKGNFLRVTGVCQDISQRRLLEEQFRQSQKMEAVGQLAAGIAHDLNNVLTVILGYSSLLLTKIEPSDTCIRGFKRFTPPGERAAAHSANSAYSRKQVLEPRILNLGSTLRDLDHLLSRVLGENIEIATIIGEDLAQVRIDPTQFQQVMLNLAVNARDAMPHGGKLTLELRNQRTNGNTPAHTTTYHPGTT